MLRQGAYRISGVRLMISKNRKKYRRIKVCNNSCLGNNIFTFMRRIKELRENAGAYCYLGTSGDFQSSLLADAKSLKKKKEYSLLKRTLVKALERFKSYCFKRIGKAFTKLQEKNDKVNIFKTV